DGRREPLRWRAPQSLVDGRLAPRSSVELLDHPARDAQAPSFVDMTRGHRADCRRYEATSQGAGRQLEPARRRAGQHLQQLSDALKHAIAVMDLIQCTFNSCFS